MGESTPEKHSRSTCDGYLRAVHGSIHDQQQTHRHDQPRPKKCTRTTCVVHVVCALLNNAKSTCITHRRCKKPSSRATTRITAPETAPFANSVPRPKDASFVTRMPNSDTPITLAAPRCLHRARHRGPAVACHTTRHVRYKTWRHRHRLA